MPFAAVNGIDAVVRPARTRPDLANSQLLAEHMPDARLRVFEGGHIFMIQDRSAFPAIIEFLRGEG